VSPTIKYDRKRLKQTIMLYCYTFYQKKKVDVVLAAEFYDFMF
jgi:hypothetical protein